MSKGKVWVTKHWLIHSNGDKSVDKLSKYPQVEEAAQFLQADELVAFPTETVYGLGANALSDQACQKIYQAKGRPSDNPLIVHIACVEQLEGLVHNFPDLARKLSEAFWPGPLTLVLPKGEQVCSTVTAGLSTVAVRMPNHPLALALIRASGLPLAAPSANRSGKPSPTRGEHVLHDLQGRIAGVLDSGESGLGVESTVVDVTGEKAVILRLGGITREELTEIVGEVELASYLQEELGLGGEPHGSAENWSEVNSQESVGQPRSPGVKYTHYAPEASLFLADWPRELEYAQALTVMRAKIKEQVHRAQGEGLRVGVLTTEEGLDYYEADCLLSLGTRTNLSSIAHHLYATLRQFDQVGVDVIYAESFPLTGLGETIMNRLLKAAGGKII